MKNSNQAASILGKASAKARKANGFDYKAVAAKTRATIIARYGEGYYRKAGSGKSVKQDGKTL